MNRRSFLQIIGAAGVAIVAAPQAVLARALDPTVPTVGPPIVPVTPVADGLQTIRIGFPDGTTWQMRGLVTSQLVSTPIDGVSESTVTFQPIGPCECIEDTPQTPQRGRQSMAALATTITVDDTELGEVQDIQLPSMHRNYEEMVNEDGDMTYIAGLKRVSPMTFVVNFGEVLVK